MSERIKSPKTTSQSRPKKPLKLNGSRKTAPPSPPLPPQTVAAKELLAQIAYPPVQTEWTAWLKVASTKTPLLWVLLLIIAALAVLKETGLLVALAALILQWMHTSRSNG